MDALRQLQYFAMFARQRLIEQVGARFAAVMAPDSAEARARPKAVEELKKAARPQNGETAQVAQARLIERVAYTWFNRFCALRYLELNGYMRVRVIGPLRGHFQPQILEEAKDGVIDETLVDAARRRQALDLLGGKTASKHAQADAYALLLVAVCNYWHKAMPFLFERIDDWTELLLPDNLLAPNSVTRLTEQQLQPKQCEGKPEALGWLYQFYVSQKKNEIFKGLRENRKIAPEDVAPATQLFTPKYIVRYLVENSLGRLWLQNHPGSALAGRMPYYIAPAQEENDFLRVRSPEELCVCDPACGSGHMLAYAFELLHFIYEEQGYALADIPALILQNNLFGMELCPRAAQLAGLSLSMKAREKHDGFLSAAAAPNICAWQKAKFSGDELDRYFRAMKRRELLTDDLRGTLQQFADVELVGSLLRPRCLDVDVALAALSGARAPDDLELRQTHEKVLSILRQVDYLRPKYHVILANPPYMGYRGMNSALSNFAKKEYADSKADTYSMFIRQNLDLTVPGGLAAMITMHSWMFLSIFEKLRKRLLAENTLLSAVHLGTRAFETIGGAVVQVVAYVLKNAHEENYPGQYLRVVDRETAADKDAAMLADSAQRGNRIHDATALNFSNISGSPIAYWATESQNKMFANFPTLGSWATVRIGLATGKNDLFLRRWHEVSIGKIGMDYESIDQTADGKHKWFPYNKGGEFRRWYGNMEYVILWENDGHAIRNFVDKDGNLLSRPQNTQHYFKCGATWTFVSASKFSVRYAPPGSVFDVAGSTALLPAKLAKRVVGFLASNVAEGILNLINPTINVQVRDIGSLPVSEDLLLSIPRDTTDRLVEIAKEDWDSYETSWGFSTLPLLRAEFCADTLEATYANLRAHWRRQTEEMQRLEVENNRALIGAYGLQDEVEADVPLRDITLTCNPHYRYSGDNSDEALEKKLLADAMRELVSYAVGCMFGRYSLHAPGLILANAGDGMAQYEAATGGGGAFLPAQDNLLPVLEDEWFAGDIAARFRAFMAAAFGEEALDENMRFVEGALGVKSMRGYFVKKFFADHVRRYKKRPIYWLFSSPSGAFAALVYLHRMGPNTADAALKCLRDYIDKLRAARDQCGRDAVSPSLPAADKTRAQKQGDKLGKMITECEAYERRLYKVATQKVKMDLDDGVRVNYAKFGATLKGVPGLSEE